MSEEFSQYDMTNDDIQELQKFSGVNIWSQAHEEAEKEILLCYEASKSKTKPPCDELEDGEVKNESDDETASKTKCSKRPVEILDIERYIENQQQMQVYKKKKVQTSVCEHSKVITKNQKLQIEKLKHPRRFSEQSPREQRDLTSNSKTDIAQFSNDHQNELHEVNLSDEPRVPEKHIRTRKKVQIECYNDESDSDSSYRHSNRKLKDSDSEYIPSEDNEDCESRSMYKPKTDAERKRGVRSSLNFTKLKDDGDINYYQNRLKTVNMKCKTESSLGTHSEMDEESDRPEDIGAKKLAYNLTLPRKVWNKLFSYQKVGVKWLCELNEFRKGGLLGDEMGLGKTVQLIALFAVLDYSKKISKFGNYIGLGPCLIVSPATVLHQWVQHFHSWWPSLRVAILHQSGSYQGKKKSHLIRQINQANGILITTYNGILQHIDIVLQYKWHYLILDEGHKIRNPDAKVSIAVKRIDTPHRIIMTGSPMQNNLTELWSLFDFITPGKLGTLQVFNDHFATPIVEGGYANASVLQEATALTIATALKDIISPFILRRAKSDVNSSIDLPNKNEQVLFCELTGEQIDLYKEYLLGEAVTSILDKGRYDYSSQCQQRAKMLIALTTLRKICNHPDLYLQPDVENMVLISEMEDRKSDYYKRAGKMRVVAALLEIWKRQGHRVLLFTQSRAMITLFVDFLRFNQYKFLKMDGKTSIGMRQPLINQFNENEEYFVFLLTTRVGGLGVNLTGANRIIIYDPDWNPATDMQARERAWRIGQQKEVTVYRLLSAGTIEEKMYQRQVWKQLLSNKVLLDPNQKRFFKTSDLQELFSLQEPMKGRNTETCNMFQHSKVELPNQNSKESIFSKEKVESMKKLAHMLAKNFSSNQTYHTRGETSLMDDTPPKSDSEPSFIWDPTTVRYRKRRKIVLSPVPPEINFVDDKETKTPFSEIFHSLDKPKRKVSCTVTFDAASVTETPPSSENDNLHIESRNTKTYITQNPPRTIINSSENNHDDSLEKHKNRKKKRKRNERDIGEDRSEQLQVPVTVEQDEHSRILFQNTVSVDNHKKSYNVDGDENKERICKTNKKDRDTITNIQSSSKSKHRKRHKSKHIPNEVDGVKVDGVLKAEIAKVKKELSEKTLNDRQNDYVLEKLFSKGVHTALQHETIVQSGYDDNNTIKIRSEADQKAKSALKALRLSRLNKWRW